MITRRFFVKTTTTLATGCAIAGISPFVALADGDIGAGAEQFIRGMADTAITNLTAAGITREERKIRMRSLMDSYFHVPGIAQWVFGRYWRKASKQERLDYLVLFEELMVETYVDRFETYSGESLEVVKTDVRSEKDAIVFSKLNRPAVEQVLKVDWRVRASGDQFRIIDVMVEGVSMGQTQRAEFASVINSHDGDIAKFLDDLKSRVTGKNSGA